MNDRPGVLLGDGGGEAAQDAIQAETPGAVQRAGRPFRFGGF